MNNIMRTSFNENFTEKSTYESHEQCTGPTNNARDPPSKNAPLENAQNALALKFFNYSGRKNRRVHPIIFFLG